MKLQILINRLLIIIFFALISYSLTGSIAVKSSVGIILAVISLGATVVFLCLMPKLNQSANEDEKDD